jgi:hypothetical protein
MCVEVTIIFHLSAMIKSALSFTSMSSHASLFSLKYSFCEHELERNVRALLFQVTDSKVRFTVALSTKSTVSYTNIITYACVINASTRSSFIYQNINIHGSSFGRF